MMHEYPSKYYGLFTIITSYYCLEEQKTFHLCHTFGMPESVRPKNEILQSMSTEQQFLLPVWGTTDWSASHWSLEKLWREPSWNTFLGIRRRRWFGTVNIDLPKVNLIALYVSKFVDERRAVDVIYLGFSKVFSTVSHSTLLCKLGYIIF